MNQSFLFLGIAIAVQSASLVLQKFVLNNIGLKPWISGNYLANFISLAFNHWIILSVIGSFVSLACWLVAITKMDIGVAYPMVSLGYVLTMIAGYYVFGETITPVKIAGTALIITGVYCLSRTV